VNFIFTPFGGLFDEEEDALFNEDQEHADELGYYNSRVKDHQLKSIDMMSLEKLKAVIWKQLMKQRKYKKYAIEHKDKIKHFIEDTYHSTTMSVDRFGNNKQVNPKELCIKIMSILDKYRQQK
jgi:hypothetical protein